MSARAAQEEMARVLAHVPHDVTVLLGVAIGPLRRERAVAPLIERLIATHLSTARPVLPACARTLVDDIEWIVIGIAEVAAMERATVIVRGAWTREVTHACGSDPSITVIDDRTIGVRVRTPPDRAVGEEMHARWSALPARYQIGLVIDPAFAWPDHLLPDRTSASAWAEVMLDHLKAQVTIEGADTDAALAIETLLRSQLAEALAQPTFGTGHLSVFRRGSRVTVSLDAGPTMLGVITSAIP